MSSTRTYPVWDANALDIYALSLDWTSLWAHAFPPMALLRVVLLKICLKPCHILLAPDTMVLRSRRSHPRLAFASTVPMGSPIPPSSRGSLGATSSPPAPPATRLSIMRVHIRQRRFSAPVAVWATSSCCPSTRGMYNSHWNIFVRRCAAQAVAPFASSLLIIADFLVHLFNTKGLLPDTISRYRSAILPIRRCLVEIVLSPVTPHSRN